MLLALLSVGGVAKLYAGYSPSERRIFLLMLEALILGLERKAGKVELESALAVCLSEAAESRSGDEYFVRNDLLLSAMHSGGEGPVQDLNLRIALGNSPIRKFLAVSLIRRAMGEQSI